MASITTPSEISTKLNAAQSRGSYRNAGQDLLSQLSTVYGPKFVEENAQVNGTTQTISQFASSNFSGWGSFIGVRNNFDALRVNAFPFDATDLPRQALVRVRLGAYDATPVAEVMVLLRNVAVNRPLEIIAELGLLIENAGNADVWIDFMTDGKVGAEASNIAVSGTAPDVLRYTTNQALSISALDNTAVAAAYQLRCTTFTCGSRNAFKMEGRQTKVYDSGTFVGWSNQIGVVPAEFNILEVPIYAYDAAVLPTQLGLRFRQNTYDGTVVAESKATVHFTGVGYEVATFFFDQDITLTGPVFLEIVANGRIAFTTSTTLGALSERYLSEVSRKPGPDSPVITAAVAGGYQWWFKTILRDRTKGIGFDGPTLTQLIEDKAGSGGGGSTPFVPVCDLTVPPFIPCVEGIETNIYWDGIFNSWLRPDQFTISVNCGRGRHDDDRWRIVPSTSGYGPAVTTDIGTTAMTIEASYNGTLLSSATTSLRIKAESVGNGQTRKCLVIGDSTTEGGAAVQQVLDQVTASSSTYAVTMLGTRGAGAAQHEGYSGKNYDYLRTSDAANKFYNAGDFDFSFYLSDNSFTMSAGDSVFLLMGINPPIFGQASDDSASTAALALLTDIAAIIASIRAAVSGINVWVGLVIPPSHDQSAFGYDYAGSTQYRARYNRNIGLLRRALLNAYSASEASNIRLCPVNCNLDTTHNMLETTEPLNAQNATTRSVQNNGVHPAASGYKQIGDMLYCCLKSLES